jgi:pyruvate formate lyase activating enzyme
VYIAGLQKLTLLDYPGKTACTVFTRGCNFRCPFCHNASLVLPEGETEGMDEDAFFALLDKRRGIWDGVCVSGGEPLLQEKLLPFLEQIKKRGYQIKLDTNGSFPRRLRQAVEAGLADYVAMDIKNAPACYARTVGRADFDLTGVQESVDYLLSGAVDYEFRTTLVRPLHSAESLRAAAQWIRGAKRYFLQGYVPGEQVLRRGGLSAFSESQMRELLALVQQVIPAAEIRGL